MRVDDDDSDSDSDDDDEIPIIAEYLVSSEYDNTYEEDAVKFRRYIVYDEIYSYVDYIDVYPAGLAVGNEEYGYIYTHGRDN
ncbi:hypothetical protein H4R24_001181 [Coemansia sp. RSA 988]|nr:hypothetical protein H4R24_001181 [Coemansia sp. RSA 988]